MNGKTEKKRIRPLRLILRVLGGLLALLLLAALVLFVIPLTETGDGTAVEGSADWMASLDDALSLDEIVLPGTHDSATRYVQLGFITKCQALSIAGQLEAGYRYLDIRLAVDGDGMKLKHGFTSCRVGPMPWNDDLCLENVLEECYGFLAAHPGETILFAVKQEYGSQTVEEFETVLDRYIRENEELWLLTDHIPSLGEARGKLVLLRRYEDEAGLGPRAGIPLLWVNQNGSADTSLNTAREDNGSYVLWVQDRYEYDAEDKWNAFTAGMERAQTGNGNVAIHFLSTKGTAAYGHPFGFARELNRRLSGLQELSGWIVVDFASAPLAEQVYRWNFS